NFRFGVSLNVIDGRVNQLKTAMDLVHSNNNLEQYNLGLEYSMNRLIFIRSGYRFNTDEGGFSLGGGLNLHMGEGLNLRADYSYADMGILKAIHRFSIEFTL
ncbi:MAG: hypothetical protein DRP96_04670, partial [Candidatus Neomarinimicrobiota bacterium]